MFALVNLPEVVKGALFARYSRSAKSLRRLFLDEFVNDLDIEGDESIDATVGLERAEELYERVFLEYGDDSVAQLGGVHLACEQASNVLTKILEWGRLMSYLEQSTRYIAYDSRLGGRYRYHRDPHVLAGRSGRATSATWTACSTPIRRRSTRHQPRPDDDPARPRRQRVRVPPGDAGEGARRHPRHAAGGEPLERRRSTARARRSRRCCCACAPTRSPRRVRYADLMLHELRKVIPSFLRRVDLPDRGGRWSEYFATTRADTADLVEQLFGGTPVDPAPEVQLVDFDPDAEDKLLAAICYSHSNLSEPSLLERVRELGADDESRSCGRTSATAATAATSRDARSSASTTASTCCPTTARSATCSGIACSRSSGSG